MKNPFAKMCTLLFIFCTLNRKKWTAAEIITEGASKLPFPCPEDLFAKHSFPRKTYNFSVTFSIEPIKLRFSAKSLQQICQNCIIWCPRNTPMKKNFTEKVTFLFQLFPHFEPKKSRLQPKCFGGSVKIAFFVSSKYFREKSIGKMNTNFSSFVGFEQKLSWSLANLFRHTCQNCFSPVQRTFGGKIILVRSRHFCPSFRTLSRKKIGY